MNDTNAVTLEEVRCEVIGTTFTGRILLHCRDGRIENIEVTERRTPPWKRAQGAAVDGKPNPL
jgi:hypothetical protein